MWKQNKVTLESVKYIWLSWIHPTACCVSFHKIPPSLDTDLSDGNASRGGITTKRFYFHQPLLPMETPMKFWLMR